ncbi:MAG TPA: inositol monophosphatase family protein [Thermoanaerobaculia bacterium]|nr:inositol monophosphatase family protein [Thermoanaerobaculia bacterium]
MNPDLQLALELAGAADAITMKFFRSASLAVRTKQDHSPVSEADEAVERTLRELLQRARPDDGILGEEFGVSGASARRWILDPIDGTKNFVRGIPVFGTLIALEENARVVAGVVSAPAIARRWWASKGEGAFCNGDAIRVSRVDSIEKAYLSSYALDEPFLALARRSGRACAFSDFWAHMLVAEGALEIAVEPKLATWDVAALMIIVEEAGGRFTDLRGNARHDGGSGVSTNGLLHDAVLEALA